VGIRVVFIDEINRIITQGGKIKPESCSEQPLLPYSCNQDQLIYLKWFKTKKISRKNLGTVRNLSILTDIRRCERLSLKNVK
jgi:hypothetical protein